MLSSYSVPQPAHLGSALLTWSFRDFPKVSILFELLRDWEVSPCSSQASTEIDVLDRTSKVIERASTWSSWFPFGKVTASSTKLSSQSEDCGRKTRPPSIRGRTEFTLATFTELSMGMSSDYRIAIAEGATMIRLGTALFGERTKPLIIQ